MRKILRPFEIDIQILSDTRYLLFLRQLLRSIVSDAKTRDRCSAALVEAVGNAIFHAHEGKIGKSIRIGININCGKIVMEIEDSGSGFDLDDVPIPKLDAVRGRGIYIIKAMMDEVEYQKNILRMTYEVLKR